MGKLGIFVNDSSDLDHEISENNHQLLNGFKENRQNIILYKYILVIT